MNDKKIKFFIKDSILLLALGIWSFLFMVWMKMSQSAYLRESHIIDIFLPVVRKIIIFPFIGKIVVAMCVYMFHLIIWKNKQLKYSELFLINCLSLAFGIVLVIFFYKFMIKEMIIYNLQLRDSISLAAS